MFAPHGPTLHTGFPPFRNEREMVGQPLLKWKKSTPTPKAADPNVRPARTLSRRVLVTLGRSDRRVCPALAISRESVRAWRTWPK